MSIWSRKYGQGFARNNDSNMIICLCHSPNLLSAWSYEQILIAQQFCSTLWHPNDEKFYILTLQISIHVYWKSSVIWEEWHNLSQVQWPWCSSLYINVPVIIWLINMYRYSFLYVCTVYMYFKNTKTLQVCRWFNILACIGHFVT